MSVIPVSIKLSMERYKNRPKRELTNKLKCKISPFKLFETLKFVLKEDNNFNLSTYYCHELRGFSIFEQKIINSMLFSFEFNEKKFNKFPYVSRIKNMDRITSLVSLHDYPILNNLTKKEISNVRAIVIFMQNKNNFHNFNPTLATKIITNHFITKNKNQGNSYGNNRKIFKDHLINGNKNTSSFYTIENSIKKSTLSKYL